MSPVQIIWFAQFTSTTRGFTHGVALCRLADTTPPTPRTACSGNRLSAVALQNFVCHFRVGWVTRSVEAPFGSVVVTLREFAHLGAWQPYATNTAMVVARRATTRRARGSTCLRRVPVCGSELSQRRLGERTEIRGVCLFCL